MPDTKGVDVCRSLEEAIEKARSYGREVFICGGGEIYRATLSKADRMILSYIDREYAGDEYFPNLTKMNGSSQKKRCMINSQSYIMNVVSKIFLV